MKRREFMLSCLLVTAGWLFPKHRFLSRLGFPLIDGLTIHIKDSPIPEKRSDVFENIENGMLVLQNAFNHKIILNRVGSIIWQNIDGKNTYDDISFLLTQVFDIDKEIATKDVTSYAISLREEGFLNIDKISRCLGKTTAALKNRPVNLTV